MNVWEGLCLAYMILTKKKILHSNLYSFSISNPILKLEVGNYNLRDMRLSTWIVESNSTINIVNTTPTIWPYTITPKNHRGVLFLFPHKQPPLHAHTNATHLHYNLMYWDTWTIELLSKDPNSTNMPYVQSYPPSNVSIILIKSMTQDEPLKTDLGRFGMGPSKGLRKRCRRSMSSKWWPSL
jgi:hypothetical protein